MVEAGRNGRLLGQEVQDRNEGVKTGCEERCRSVLGWRMGRGFGTQKLKGKEPESSRTVGRGYIRRYNSDVS